MVVENAEIVLIQVAHELAMLVGRDEKYIDLIHPGVQRDHRALRIVTASILNRAANRVVRVKARRP